MRLGIKHIKCLLKLFIEVTGAQLCNIRNLYCQYLLFHTFVLNIYIENTQYVGDVDDCVNVKFMSDPILLLALLDLRARVFGVVYMPLPPSRSTARFTKVTTIKPIFIATAIF